MARKVTADRQKVNDEKEKDKRFIIFFSYWLNSLRRFKGLLCQGRIPICRTNFLEFQLRKQIHSQTLKNSKFSFKISIVVYFILSFFLISFIILYFLSFRISFKLVKRKLSSNSHLHLAKHPELHYRAVIREKSLECRMFCTRRCCYGTKW